MAYILTPYAIAHFAASLISIGLTILVWKRRYARGGWFLFYLFIAISLWTFANSMESAAVFQDVKIFWSKIAHIGSQVSPVFILLYAVEYTGRKNILSEFKIGILFIVPIFTILLAATNESHGLIWSGFSPGPSGTNSLIYSHGVLFWVSSSYNFFLASVASFLLYFSTVGSQRIYKRQNRMIIAATLFPWIGSILSIIGMNAFLGLDLISISFLFSGLILFWAISREKLLDVVPVSHEFLVENIEDGILVIDENFRIIEINSSVEKMLDLDRKELIGKSVQEHIPFWNEVSSLFNQDTSEKVEINLKSPNFEYLQIHISPLYYSKKRYIGWVLMIEDITLRKKAELELHNAKNLLEIQLVEIQSLQSKLREQALHDALSGTFNRGYLDDTLARELARSKRKGYALCVFMIDLDNFKVTNDTFGHRAGDMVIAGTGKMLVDETRACDCVCRFGGDEFVVIAPEMQKEDAITRAEKWCEMLKQTQIQFNGEYITTTISVGLAVYPADGKDADTLIDAADKALYKAKADGRDCVRAY